MAEQKPSNLVLMSQGFGSLPVLRQLALTVAIAVALALAGTIIMWAKDPNYRVLYNGLADKDIMSVTSALQSLGIDYQIVGAGTVKVAADKVHEARMNLASQGLPNSTTKGFELLDQDQGFGTSQFMEKARYQRALEGELAHTISTIRNVESARVHIAVPKQSAFLRDRKPPSASVSVNLFPGRQLGEEQVASIVHLVASSVPDMEPDHVVVVDQMGRLLTSPQSTGTMSLTTSQFAYRRKLEDYFIDRIESLIEPMVGTGGIRAQVTAELDYSVTEQTQESFNPDMAAVRSEQTIEEQTRDGAAAGGVPGALTNQPPAGGTTAAAQPAEAPGAEGSPSQSNRRVIRNYELDRTISHVRTPGGEVRRLSVAVVVDDRQVVGDAGEVTRQPLTEEELNRITSLVRDAIGFDARRGDTVSVINSAFSQPPPVEPLPEPSLMEQAWVWDAGKWALGALGFLFVLFGVLKPLMRSLAEKGASVPMPRAQLFDEQQMLQGQMQNPQLAHLTQYENDLTAAKNLARQDPKVVAQVVKQWVSTDG